MDKIKCEFERTLRSSGKYILSLKLREINPCRNYGNVCITAMVFLKNFVKATFSLILIKIIQFHYLVRIFLQNRTTDFDETLHVAWVCPGEGFSTIGSSGYSPV